MKFLAILRDSLREAIDSKVFYVMLGLSTLLILGVSTISFTPKAEGKEFMMKSAASLMVEDQEKFDPKAFMQAVLMRPQGAFEVLRAGPLDGMPDGPFSRFQVLLRATPVGQDEKEKAAISLDRVRDHFGQFGKIRFVQVLAAKQVERPTGTEPGGEGETFYELEVKPTSTGARLWPHTFSLFFGGLPFGDAGVPLGFQLYLIESWLVGGLGAWVAVLVSVVITAFFIPNMLRKGTVDLLIVKPIPRTALLCYKFLGGLTFILVNTTFAVVGVWVALGLRSGVWAPAILYMIPAITFSFAILYSVSTLAAVLTRSPIVAILATCAFWAMLFAVAFVYNVIDGHRRQDAHRREEVKQELPQEVRMTENWFTRTVDAIYFVLPRKGDLDRFTGQILLRDLLTDQESEIPPELFDSKPINWTETMTVSLLYIAVFLGLSCWWFATRDY